MMINKEKTVYSVSQLNRKAKQLLETYLPLIWVSGELSNLAQPRSGHWYFSLKDDKAQVKCAMFRQSNQRLRLQPQAGEVVTVRARVSLYEGRGDYQLIVEHMETAGTGALQQAYEKLKNQLEAEGLFDENHKQAPPVFPNTIGIITSATGAAIRDILSVLKRRYPIAKALIIPATVQGSDAPADIILALEKAQQYGKLDTLIITRGGGSMEDLWGFNDEMLARKIAACQIPTISAVGHEVDFTICDLVADVRAPTPSASAEIATPDILEWQQTLDNQQQHLFSLWQMTLHQKQQALHFLQKRLRHPRERLEHQKQLLANQQHQLTTAMKQCIANYKAQVDKQTALCQQHDPQKNITRRREAVQRHQDRLIQAIHQQVGDQKNRLGAQCQLLQALSPLTVLGRGYAIVSHSSDNSVVHSTRDIKVGDQLKTRLGQGKFTCKVSSIE